MFTGYICFFRSEHSLYYTSVHVSYQILLVLYLGLYGRFGVHFPKAWKQIMSRLYMIYSLDTLHQKVSEKKIIFVHVEEINDTSHIIKY